MRAAAAFIASFLLSAVLLPAVLLSATPPSNPLPGPAGVSYGTIATYFCALTGCTMTGQTVYSGVSPDIITAGSENLTLTPGGTGLIVMGRPVDQGANYIYSSASRTCGGTANFTGVCILDDVMQQGAGAKLYLDGYDSANDQTVSFLFATTNMGSIGFFGNTDNDADLQGKVGILGRAAGLLGILLGNTGDVAAASVLIDVRDNTAATGVPHLYVKGAGLVALGVTPQALTCTDSGGAGTGALNVDPQSSTVIITNNDAVGGCVATVQETTVSGTTNALGARVTICSSPQSQATLLTFADVANVFRGGASQATGLLPGDCFDMVYIDATDDLWLATGPVSIN